MPNTPPDIIRVEFERLATVPGLFTDEAERVAAALSALKAHLPFLRAGWEGPAADTFFADMDTDIRPALRRLVHALRHGAEVSALMLRVLDEAEQAAARIDWSGGGVVGAAATSGDGAVVAPVLTAVRAAVNGVDDVDGANADSLMVATYSEVPANSTVKLTIPSAQIDQVFSSASVSLHLLQTRVSTGAFERAETYQNWSLQLQQLNSISNGIRFYSAARRVTLLLGLLDHPDLRGMLSIYLHPVVQVERLANFLKHIGEELLQFNQTIHQLAATQRLETTSGALVSPLNPNYIFELLQDGYSVDEHGRLIQPDGVATAIVVATVDSALDWDIAMIVREQLKVHDLTLNYASTVGTGEHAANMAGLGILLNLNDQPALGVEAVVAQGVLFVDFSAVDWAERALHATGVQPNGSEQITFANLDHRVALGIAMVFQEHGLNEEDYQRYMMSMTVSSGTSPQSTPTLVGDTPPPPTGAIGIESANDGSQR